MTVSTLNSSLRPIVCVDFINLAKRVPIKNEQLESEHETIVQKMEVGLSIFQDRANPPRSERIDFDDDFKKDISHLPPDVRVRTEKQRNDLLQEYGSRPGNYHFEDDKYFHAAIYGNRQIAELPLHDSCDSVENSQDENSAEDYRVGLSGRLKHWLNVHFSSNKSNKEPVVVNPKEELPATSEQEDNIRRYQRYVAHMRSYFLKKGLEDKETQDRIFTILMQNAGGLNHVLSSMGTSFLLECVGKMLKVNQDPKKIRLSLTKVEDGSFKLMIKTPLMLINEYDCTEAGLAGTLQMEIHVPKSLQQEATLSQFKFLTDESRFASELNENLNKKAKEYAATKIDNAVLSDACLATLNKTPATSLSTHHYNAQSHNSMLFLVAASTVVCVAAFTVLAVAIFCPAALPAVIGGLLLLKKIALGAIALSAAMPATAAVATAVKNHKEQKRIDEHKAISKLHTFWSITGCSQNSELTQSQSAAPSMDIGSPAPTNAVSDKDQDDDLNAELLDTNSRLNTLTI